MLLVSIHLSLNHRARQICKFVVSATRKAISIKYLPWMAVMENIFFCPKFYLRLGTYNSMLFLNSIFVRKHPVVAEVSIEKRCISDILTKTTPRLLFVFAENKDTQVLAHIFYRSNLLIVFAFWFYCSALLISMRAMA